MQKPQRTQRKNTAQRAQRKASFTSAHASAPSAVSAFRAVSMTSFIFSLKNPGWELSRMEGRRLALLSLLGCCLLLLFGCSETYTPKPWEYFRIDLPAKAYRKYIPTDCPFAFEYPVYAEIERDTLFFDKAPENPCWMNIDFKELGGKIHISYKEIDEKNSYEKLLEDAHKLAFKHTSKADFIGDQQVQNDKGVSGVWFELGGNAASNAQFFLTDSVHHFIRGSLYFSSTPNEDSLKPVINFVKEDMIKMLETFEWTDSSNQQTSVQ